MVITLIVEGGMSMTKTRGCIISEPVITPLFTVVSSTWTLFCSRGYWLAISKPTAVIILYYILTAMVAAFGKTSVTYSVTRLMLLRKLSSTTSKHHIAHGNKQAK